MRPRPIYQPIAVCISLLKALGFKSIKSRRKLKRDKIVAPLKKWRETLDMEYVHMEFEIRKKRLNDEEEWDFKRAKGLADTILKQVLGLILKATNTKSEEFHLQPVVDFSRFEKKYPNPCE